MKSTVTNKPCNKEKPFPKLMIDSRDKQIILFVDDSLGVVVYQRKSNDAVGEWSDEWEMMHFSDFNGSVCLENGD